MTPIPRPADRDAYRPSGRVFLPVFVPLVALALVAAAGGAALIYLSGNVGMRFVLITPIVLALPAGGLMYLACRAGKCRNRVVAFVVGAVVGLVVSPGRYHAELVAFDGWDVLPRLDLLPGWLEFRMSFKMIGKAGVGPAGGPQPADTVDLVMNWVMFAIEVGGIAFGIGAVAVGAAAQPFDEGHKEWMASKTLILPSGAAEGVAAALAARDREKLAEELDRLGQQAVPHCAATIHYPATALRAGEDAAGYLSATEIGIANKEGHRRAKTIFSQWKLDPDELRRVAPILSDAPRPDDDAPRAKTVEPI